jgi:hypothetical protein
VTHDSAFPFLTVLILLPAGAGLVVALVPRSFGERAPAGRCGEVGLAGRAPPWRLAVTIAVRYHAGNGELPAGERPPVGAVARDRVAPRGRRDLGLPHAHVGRAVPAGAAGRQGTAATPVLRGLAAAARGGLSGELRGARPHPVLPVLRADPGAGVLHRGRLGIRPAGLRGDEVLPLHLPRFGLPVGGDRGRGHHPRTADRGLHLRPGVAHPHPSGPRVADPAVPGLHLGLRREGPDLPLPHLVPRRLRRGPGRGVGDPGRGDGQARDLRDHPVRPEPVPAGRGRPGPAAPHPGGGGDPLRGHRGLCHQGPEDDWWPTRRWPTSASSCSGPSP